MSFSNKPSDEVRNAERVYIDWLCDTFIGSTKGRMGLLLYLLEEPFVALVKFDGDRAEDALYIRNRFYRYAGSNASNMKSLPVSALEVLVVLSVKAAELLDGMAAKNLNEPELYFWKFIDNLGLLTSWTVGDQLSSTASQRTAKIVSKWLKREYGNDGKGSCFPVDYVSIRPQNSMSKIDMWHQLNVWCEQNCESFVKEL
jgi:hypothetical protein